VLDHLAHVLYSFSHGHPKPAITIAMSNSRSLSCYCEPYISEFHLGGGPERGSCTGGTRKGLPCITYAMDISCHNGLVWWVSGRETTPAHTHAMASVTAKLSQDFKHMSCIAKLLGLSKWRALASRACIHAAIAVMSCWCFMESKRLAYRRRTTRNM
jgi:hypothetical protein